MSNGCCVIDFDGNVGVDISGGICSESAISSGEVCYVINDACGVIDSAEDSINALDLSDGGCIVDGDIDVDVVIDVSISGDGAIYCGEI